MRTIDADALLDNINHMVFTSDLTTTVAVGMACKWIEDAPTIEPEQKTGKWIKISPAGIYECSKCGQEIMTDDIDVYAFCHGCGAKMEKSLMSGKWICSDDMYETAVCSVCGWDSREPWDNIRNSFKFCPICGTKMEDKYAVN